MKCQKTYYHQQNDSSLLRKENISIVHEIYQTVLFLCRIRLWILFTRQMFNAQGNPCLKFIANWRSKSTKWYERALISTAYVNSLFPLYLHQHPWTLGSWIPLKDVNCMNGLAALAHRTLLVIFFLYEPSSVHVLLFHWATTWLNHNPRAAKLNLRIKNS